MRHRRHALAAVLAASLVLTAAACGTSSDSGAGVDPAVTVMLDWTANTNHVGLYVAQKLGYYRDAGVDVTILPTAQSGAETAVETGVADLGFTTLSNVAAVNAQGSDLQFVFDLTQKPVARWCSLASRTDITSPADFSGKTFVSFGSAEQTAVVRQMIESAGGSGEFDTVAVGTSTFQTLTSGQGDFGGFYETWEGVESRLNGPELTCFVASDWGVPGNPDQLGYAANADWADSHSEELHHFLDATARGYAYALDHPKEAAALLVEEASDAALDPELTAASMAEIVDGDYWGDSAAIAAASKSATDSTTAAEYSGLGVTDTDAAQSYLDFLWKNGVYRDADDSELTEAPQAAQLSTNRFVSAQ